MTNRGDRLLAEVAVGADDTVASQLLNEFFSGYPVERLRELLRSRNEATAKVGTWIASELGQRAAPLMDDLARLLVHSSRYVRFFALDSILAGATAEHGEALAGAVRLIEDQDEAVRWKALNFLARAGYDQLAASVSSLHDGHLAGLVEWLLEIDRTCNTAFVTERIQDGSNLRRMFAAVAAVRLAAYDQSPLSHVAASSDEEISSFAREHLEALRGA